MVIDAIVEGNENPKVIESFLKLLREKGHVVEDDRLLARRNVYRVDGRIHLLVRTSRYHEDKRYYFFGLTRHIFENFAQLPNAVVAFVFADSLEPLLVPAQLLFQERGKISADRKQYKLAIDKSFRLLFWKPKREPLDLSPFLRDFSLLTAEPPAIVPPAKYEPKAEKTKHAALQGMILELGNALGFQTYCPNKAWHFKDKTLGEISTIKNIPEFPGLDMTLVRQIDVIWLDDKGQPKHAFEIELTTGIWTGLIRLAELKSFNMVFHVVTSGNERAFSKRVTNDLFTDIRSRCYHATTKEIEELYQSETRIESLRKKLGI